jgi:hypothetical protein
MQRFGEARLPLQMVQEIVANGDNRAFEQDSMDGKARKGCHKKKLPKSSCLLHHWVVVGILFSGDILQ